MKNFFLFSLLTATCTSFAVNAHEPTQDGQSPEFLLQALCRGNGHIGSSIPGIDSAINVSKNIYPPLKPGNRVAENYKIADLTYQNLGKKDLKNCHEYSDNKLTELINRQLLIINKK